MKISKIFLTLLLTFTIISANAITPINHKNYPALVNITTSTLNVRCGPGTWYEKVGQVYKNQKIVCFGKIGDWFIVQLDNNVIGFVSGDYAEPYYKPEDTLPEAPSKTATPTSTSAPTPVPTPASTPIPTVTLPPSSYNMTSEERMMFDMINSDRVKNGLTPYIFNDDVLQVARVKAEDLVINNYFSHQSPTYGSPFDMLKSFGVSYRAAGENIAQHSSVQNAHVALMNSAGHRANILSSNFDQMAIAIYQGPGNNKTFVQLFIKK